MEHPKDVGDRTTLAVMLALRDAGFAISVPFGENTRYDLVIDDGVRLLRAQRKTGRLRNGSIFFATCSTYGHHLRPGQARRVYTGQIDSFGVYCPETRGVYLIPLAHVPTRSSAALPVERSLNGQRKRVRVASDYQVGAIEVAEVGVTPEPRASSGAQGSSA